MKTSFDTAPCLTHPKTSLRDNNSSHGCTIHPDFTSISTSWEPIPTVLSCVTQTEELLYRMNIHYPLKEIVESIDNDYKIQREKLIV